MSTIADFIDNPDDELAKFYENSRDKCIGIQSKKFPLLKDKMKDIFQQAVLILLENLDKGKLVNGSLLSYVLGIMNNLCLESVRAIKKDREIKDKTITDKIVFEDESFLVKLKEERILHIKEKLGELGEPCKTLLELFYLKEKSYEEIVAVMKYKNVNTAKSKKYKCFKRLLNLISDI